MYIRRRVLVDRSILWPDLSLLSEYSSIAGQGTKSTLFLTYVS